MIYDYLSDLKIVVKVYLSNTNLIYSQADETN